MRARPHTVDLPHKSQPAASPRTNRTDRTPPPNNHSLTLNPTYVSGIERGVRNPTWERITALAGALGVTIATLAQATEDEAEVAHAVRDARERAEARRRN